MTNQIKIEHSGITVEDFSRLSEKPLVSICCITYNHERFIRDAIEGFLMQKTDFPIEILIHDDASTDGTANIVRAYQEKNPHLIRAIYQKENQHSQGKKVIHTLFRMVRGTYIAHCEGDDYWTDPLKLQKQVEFMEAHPECSICCHGVTFSYQDGRPDHYGGFLVPKRNTYTLRDLCKVGFISTCSTVYRNNLYTEFPSELKTLAMGDWPLHILNAEHGIIWFIDDDMATYRVHENGYWSGMDIIDRKIKVIDAYMAINTYLGGRFEREIMTSVWAYWLKISELYARSGNIEQSRQYLGKCIKNIKYKGRYEIKSLILTLLKILFPNNKNTQSF